MRLSRCARPLAGLGAVLTLVLTACGGGGSPAVAPAGLSAAQVLAKVGETSASIEAYKFSMEMTSTGALSMTMKANGLAQIDPLAMDFEFTDFSAAGQDMSGMRLILLDDTFFMKIPLLSEQLGAEWVRLDLSSLDALSGLGFEEILDQARQNDPMTQMKVLLASKDVRAVGAETIDGVATTHYSGSVDVAQIADLADVGAELRDQMKQAYETLGVTKIDFELWVDEQYLTRKMVMTMPGSESTQTIAMTMSDYGKPVTVEAPPEADTVDLAQFIGQ